MAAAAKACEGFLRRLRAGDAAHAGSASHGKRRCRQLDPTCRDRAAQALLRVPHSHVHQPRVQLAAAAAAARASALLRLELPLQEPRQRRSLIRGQRAAWMGETEGR